MVVWKQSFQNSYRAEVAAKCLLKFDGIKDAKHDENMVFLTTSRHNTNLHDTLVKCNWLYVTG